MSDADACVKCGSAETVGHAYGGRQDNTGRVCKAHAEQAKTAGAPVAYDAGGGDNWGKR